MNQQSYTVIMIIFLVLFSIYRRVRRSIGWQQLRQRNMLFRITISFVIGLIFLVEGAFHPISLISDVVGILIGIILAYYSAVMTRFEQRDGRLYYRPNNWFGGAVIAIFFGRLIYRIYEMYMLGGLSGVNGGQTGDLQNIRNTIGNSWSAGLLLIMFAYYVIYYTILLRKQKQSIGANAANNW